MFFFGELCQRLHPFLMLLGREFLRLLDRLLILPLDPLFRGLKLVVFGIDLRQLHRVVFGQCALTSIRFGSHPALDHLVIGNQILCHGDLCRFSAACMRASADFASPLP